MAQPTTDSAKGAVNDRGAQTSADQSTAYATAEKQIASGQFPSAAFDRSWLNEDSFGNPLTFDDPYGLKGSIDRNASNDQYLWLKPAANVAGGSAIYTFTWESSTQSGQPGPRLIVKGPPTSPAAQNNAKSAEWIVGQYGDADIEILFDLVAPEITAKMGAAQAAQFGNDPGGWLALHNLVGSHWVDVPGYWNVPNWPPGPDIGGIIAGIGEVIGGAVGTAFGLPGATSLLSSGVGGITGTLSANNDPNTSGATQAAAAQQAAATLAAQLAQQQAAAAGAGAPKTSSTPTPTLPGHLSRTAVVGIGIGAALLVTFGLGFWLVKGNK
jgi:hypothetical protein